MVEEEEPGQPELVDQGELVVEARTRLPSRRCVALAHGCVADRSQLADRRLLTVREVGVAVAELLGQVELEPLRQRRASPCGGPVEREPLEHLLGRAQVALAVSAALGLAPLERGAAADRDEDVLHERATRVMRVDVPGRDRLDAQVLGEVAQETESPRIPPLERPLQLDVEPLSAEGARQACRRVRIEEPEPATRTAGEAHQPRVQLTDALERHRRRERLPILASGATCSRMRRREQSAQVRVALA